ncbi:MerR family transcriptional regulator [Lactobacillus sp. CC-MHH1034]|uniref:MerR family transcriptional regulator n=1 Tax=Agrilactobacillus fermenti TaxID=2586909 RepID=UPI001E4F876D|nr:MerR family transcriptional regulator [Agrilactobacillus fermenti]MCD2256893.1 MerR family transcriptional regulator [Agrilactobacillus fermenti]
MDTTREYKIGDFAKLVGLTTFTLRYYENEGLIQPHRNRNGRRFYTTQDSRWVGFLLHLKGTGMTMTELKQYVQLRAQGDQTIAQRKALLRQVQTRCRNEIAERKANLTILNHKIDWYDGKLTHEISDDESFADYLKKFNENS